MILGREAEFAKLEDLLTSLRSGEGLFLALTGEPGIGKTTLLDWTEAAATGVRVLRATGRESEGNLPFVALADLLRPLHGGVGALPSPQAQALGSALALVPAVSGDRLAVNTAAANLVADAAQSVPLLLLLDDYQWIDSASREVIDFLARRTAPLGYGMVIATRGPKPPDHKGSEVVVMPLPDDVAKKVVAGRQPSSAEVMQKVVDLAGGNPLGLIELPLDLSAYQSDHSLPISEAIGRAYRARVDELPHETRQALLVAAVEGSGSLANLRAGLSAVGLPANAIDPATASDLLIVEGSSLRFRHPLLRSVVVASAPRELVTEIHTALAESVTDEDQRAWHRAAATVGPDEGVAQNLEDTGQRALARGAAATAAEALERAANLSEDRNGKSRRLAGAVRAAHRAGLMALTARLLETARAESLELDPSLLILEADIRMRRGDYAGAYGALRLEAGAIAGRDPDKAVTMLLLASKLRVYRFEAKEGLREVEEALALLPTSERNLVHLAALGMVTTMAGETTARDWVLAAAESAFVSVHGHMHTLGIGWPLVWLEDYERAYGFITRSVSIQRQGGHLAYLPQALLALAEVDYRTGRWEPARSHAEEALRLFQEGEQPTEAAVASAYLARLEAVSGSDEAATRHATVAFEGDLRSGLQAASAFASAALGLLALGRGKYDKAIEHLLRVQSITTRGEIGEPWLLPYEPDLAEAFLRLGMKTEASEIADRLVAVGEARGRRSAVAAGFRCLAMAAPTDSYRPFFEKALALHDEMPTPFERARTELCFGERLRRDGLRLDARAHLRKALAIFETLGAEPWITRTQSELAASGERLQKRNPVIALTPQERQVADLVSRGATNREVAAILFVSPKTIEFHLGNIYRKLGVRSRTELAAATQRFPGLEPEVAPALSG